jgi:hypothetical protein
MSNATLTERSIAGLRGVRSRRPNGSAVGNGLIGHECLPVIEYLGSWRRFPSSHAKKKKKVANLGSTHRKELLSRGWNSAQRRKIIVVVAASTVPPVSKNFQLPLCDRKLCVAAVEANCNVLEDPYNGLVQALQTAEVQGEFTTEGTLISRLAVPAGRVALRSHYVLRRPQKRDGTRTPLLAATS